MRRSIIATAAAFVAAAQVGAEPLPLDGHVEPATLTSTVADDAAPTGRNAATGHPLPLASGANASTAVPHGSARPLPDWRLLAALAAAFALVGGYRIMAGRTKASLPADVFEVLGEAALGTAHSVRVVRFGPRTLLVSLSSAGCQTLAELTDPQATDCIVAACRGSRPRSPVAVSPGGRGRAAAHTAEVRG